MMACVQSSSRDPTKAKHLNITLLTLNLLPPYHSSPTTIAILFLPADILAGCLLAYIIIPVTALKSGLIIAWKGSIDEEKNLVGDIDTSNLPWIKLFEHIGEALPQIILAVVFSSNNFPFLVAKDIIIPYVPTTLISIIFSCGSLCMGMYTGIKSCLEEINDDDD